MIWQFFSQYGFELLLTLTTGGITLCFRRIYQGVRTRADEADSIKEGMRALMRSEIIRNYNKYVEDEHYGYAPIYVKQTIEEMYHTYHSLGGNGVITNLKDAILSLPTEPKESKGETYYDKETHPVYQSEPHYKNHY
ncbi:MAG: hypothetical protein J1F02_07890 [Lachnospiraceae bacterium]|nr:hypothetical protein [Lachnospiraceae bacterium]